MGGLIWSGRKRMWLLIRARHYCIKKTDYFVSGEGGRYKDIIDHFQSLHYVLFLVLSLKAGGVGLNLTQANHVIHFDRWWNPAIENQATDRAFRIGQKKNVMVHKFICKGTIEEKIDKMLETKSGLLNQVLESSGESWLTEMDNGRLMDLFKLSL
jgi:non-specific serine/threonine protein kinase